MAEILQLPLELLHRVMINIEDPLEFLRSFFVFVKEDVLRDAATRQRIVKDMIGHAAYRIANMLHKGLDIDEALTAWACVSLRFQMSSPKEKSVHVAKQFSTSIMSIVRNLRKEQDLSLIESWGRFLIECNNRLDLSIHCFLYFSWRLLLMSEKKSSDDMMERLRQLPQRNDFNKEAQLFSYVQWEQEVFVKAAAAASGTGTGMKRATLRDLVLTGMWSLRSMPLRHVTLAAWVSPLDAASITSLENWLAVDLQIAKGLRLQVGEITHATEKEDVCLRKRIAFWLLQHEGDATREIEIAPLLRRKAGREAFWWVIFAFLRAPGGGRLLQYHRGVVLLNLAAVVDICMMYSGQQSCWQDALQLALSALLHVHAAASPPSGLGAFLQENMSRIYFVELWPGVFSKRPQQLQLLVDEALEMKRRIMAEMLALCILFQRKLDIIVYRELTLNAVDDDDLWTAYLRSALDRLQRIVGGCLTTVRNHKWFQHWQQHGLRDSLAVASWTCASCDSERIRLLLDIKPQSAAFWGMAAAFGHQPADVVDALARLFVEFPQLEFKRTVLKEYLRCVVFQYGSSRMVADSLCQLVGAEVVQLEHTNTELLSLLRRLLDGGQMDAFINDALADWIDADCSLHVILLFLERRGASLTHPRVAAALCGLAERHPYFSGIHALWQASPEAFVDSGPSRIRAGQLRGVCGHQHTTRSLNEAECAKYHAHIAKT